VTYKATAVKVHQDPGSTLTSVPLTSVQWYEVEDVPCGVPCWEKGTAVSVWTVEYGSQLETNSKKLLSMETGPENDLSTDSLT